MTTRSLASLEMPEYGIHKMSRNAMIANAEIVVEKGGWEAFKDHRKKVRNLLTQASRKSDRQRRSAGVRTELNEATELRLKLLEANRARILLNRAYFDLHVVLRGAASKDQAIAAKLKRHNTLYGERLGIRVVEKNAKM